MCFQKLSKTTLSKSTTLNLIFVILLCKHIDVNNIRACYGYELIHQWWINIIDDIVRLPETGTIYRHITMQKII